MLSKDDIQKKLDATIDAEISQHLVKSGVIQKEVDVIINNDQFYHDDTEDFRDDLRDYINDGSSMSLYD